MVFSRMVLFDYGLWPMTMAYGYGHSNLGFVLLFLAYSGRTVLIKLVNLFSID